jgi:hypothetical protein
MNTTGKEGSWLIVQGLRPGLNDGEEPQFDGEKEAHLLAIACSHPPEGQKRWTLHLLADKMVELQHFASISHETIRQHVKKVNLNPG